MRIALIGAGAISLHHLNACKAIDEITVAAICDMSADLLQARAKEFGIPKVYTDYHDVLNDPTIDAVSILTPTFTHAKFVREALAAGKHVLCEKPPALTYEDALVNEKVAKESGKVLMYAFVCRFKEDTKFFKQLIDKGQLGNIYYAEASRVMNCFNIGGWFRDKSKSGGGCLMDAALHELDLLLYCMNYPKVKSVKGFSSIANSDLPERIQGFQSGYTAANNASIPRTIESFATGYITFEDDRNLIIKAGYIANTPTPGRRLELIGDKGGIAVEKDTIKLLMIDESNYFVESSPLITKKTDPFEMEIRHFLACCRGEEECIVTPNQGSQLVRIINAIYESAETGKEICF